MYIFLRKPLKTPIPDRIKFLDAEGKLNELSIDDFRGNEEGWNRFLSYRRAEKARKKAGRHGLRQRFNRANKKIATLKSTIKDLEQQKDLQAAEYLKVNFVFINYNSFH